MEYYFGATGGGLWKTADAGQTWAPVTDGKITSSSIGAVQVCEADPEVVYIGGGETQIRGNIQQGDGVYKSTDGGETWRHLGLGAAQNIARIRIHPTDCNTVWVAAFGVHSMPNPDRGIFKSTNGGETWRKVEKFPGVPELAGSTCSSSARTPARMVRMALTKKVGSTRPNSSVARW